MMIEAEYKTQNSRDVLLIPLYLALTMGAMNIPMLSFFLSVFILINIQPKHSDVRLIFSLIAGVSLSLMAAARPVAFEQFSDTDVYYGIYQAICDGAMSVLTLYGGGVEGGIVVFFFLLFSIGTSSCRDRVFQYV